MDRLPENFAYYKEEPPGLARLPVVERSPTLASSEEWTASGSRPRIIR
jgi:hypothetical protein